MYEVSVQAGFSSAHSLRGYKGKCEDLHGHNWRVEATAASGKLNDIGMVVDFSELKRILKEIVLKLDHKHLNEIEYFKSVNPTSENIAKFIHDEMSVKSPKLDIKRVTVWETDTSRAAYGV